MFYYYFSANSVFIVLSFSQQFSSMNLSRRAPPTLTARMESVRPLFHGVSSTWQPATIVLPSCIRVCTAPRWSATFQSSSGTTWRTPLKNLSNAPIALTDASVIKIWGVTFSAYIWNQTKSKTFQMQLLPLWIHPL